MARVPVRLLCFFLLLSVGVGSFLGYSHIKLKKEQTSLQQKVKKLNKRVALLQRKYAEKRVLAEQQVREKFALAGRKRVVEAEVERLLKENRFMLEENKTLNALKDKLKDETVSLKTNIEELSGSYSKVMTELADLERKYDRVVMGFDQDLKRLAAEKKTLRSEVRRERQKFHRCESNNARLCLIANELIQKYRNKGLVSALMQKEPFTQLEKVEMEKFMLQYKEKIEEQKLERKRVEDPPSSCQK